MAAAPSGTPACCEVPMIDRINNALNAILERACVPLIVVTVVVATVPYVF